MGISWMTVLAAVPWTEVIKNAPKVAEGARKLWSSAGRKGAAAVIIRSVEPDSLVGGDRLDFTVLDADGDGAVDRREAASDASLRAEFDRVDANRDGRLDRDELAGWIL